MIIEPLIIKPTHKTLSIELYNGELNFSGCSINNDPKSFFSPVTKWVGEYSNDPPQETTINVKFEYIDSASVKAFYEILKELKNATRFKQIKINWHFDIDDPEILELGEIIQSKLDIEFRFIEYKEE